MLTPSWHHQLRRERWNQLSPSTNRRRHPLHLHAALAESPHLVAALDSLLLERPVHQVGQELRGGAAGRQLICQPKDSLKCTTETVLHDSHHGSQAWPRTLPAHLQAHFAAHHHSLGELLHHVLHQACRHTGVCAKGSLKVTGTPAHVCAGSPATGHCNCLQQPAPRCAAAAPEWSGSVWDTST